MRITIDTDKGIFIVPNTFKKTLAQQNEILKKNGVKDVVITPKKFIEDAVNEAFKHPIISQEQYKSWDPSMQDQFAE